MQLDKEFHKAGVRQNSASAPPVITLEWIQGECATLERVLRLQYEEGKLSPEDELALANLPPGNTTNALRRWAYLKHCYIKRSDTPQHRAADPDEAERAVRQLLRREPFKVDLGTRIVEVTGRGYAAMLEIAAHDARRSELEMDLRRATEMASEVMDRMLDEGPRERRRLRRHYRKISQVRRRILLESSLHRQAIYAHAFTPDGTPATSIRDAPEWWEEIDPAADAALLVAMLDVGPGRYSRIGPMPEPDPAEKAREEQGEKFGWSSLLASLERSQNARPASYFDLDLFGLLTWLRAGAPPKLKSEEKA